MAFRLPRLPKDLPIVDAMRRGTSEFRRWWQSAMEGIESTLLDLQDAIDRITTNETDIAAIEAVTFTAGNGLTGGGNILTSPTFAVGAGTGIVVGADTVSVSAKLALYDGGDTPSAFTLGIVDSADAAAWRAAIGAGTSSTAGTVTSVAASVPTGFSITGSPVTNSGTLAITYTAGYQGYTSAEATKLSGIATGATANTGTVTSVNASGGTTGFSFSGGPVTNSGTLTLTGACAVASGGTNLTSYTAGDILYAAGATTLAKRGIGANNYVLTSNGTAPVWTQNTGTGNVVRASKPTIAAPVLSATPSADWGIDFAPSGGPVNLVAIANGATYDIAAGSGLMAVYEDGGAGCGLFLMAYGAVNIISQVGTGFTNTSGTASKMNVYFNGAGSYRIQNLTGGAISVFLSTIRFRTIA